MAFFGAGTSLKTTAPPTLTKMPIQSSVYGICIPLYFGTSRQAGNLLWYGDFKSITVNNPSSGGGKGGIIGGGGKGGGAGSQTQYLASFAYGLSSGGPSGIANIYNTWISQTLQAGYAPFSLFDGLIGQSPWSFLVSNHPTEAIGYSGIAYLGVPDANLGTSANIPSYNFEGGWIFAGSAPGTYGGNGCQNGGDADPSLIVAFLLTDPIEGAGLQAGDVGDVATVNDAVTVPGAPYKVTVPNFLFNINATNAAGALLTCVAGVPAAATEYAFNETTGEYTFHSSLSGTHPHVRYASIVALTKYQNSSLALGLWISPAYSSQTNASSMIDEIVTNTYADVVESSGVIQFIPRSVNALTANGYTFTPDTAPDFDLGYDDFIETGNDPVQISRKNILDQVNTFRLDCLDRANQYAPAEATAFDMAHRQQYGERSPQGTASAQMFCDLNAANTSAFLQLQDEAISNTAKFSVDPRYVLFDPMDFETVTDPNFPGITRIPVRLTQIDERDDGGFDCTAEIFVDSAGLPAQFTLKPGSGFDPDFDVDPGDVNDPIVFAIPPALATNQGLEMGVAISGSSPAIFGGAQIWGASDSGGPYKLIDSVNGATTMGLLTANFPAGADPDGVNTLSVNLAQSAGELGSGSNTDADQGNTVCMVGGAAGLEYVSYSTATLTSANHYDLTTYLRRGQQGSAIVGHLTGDPFVKIDALLGRIPFTPDQVGQTMYFKILAINNRGGGLQSLSDVSPYTITLGAPPKLPAVSGFGATQSGNVVNLTWIDLPFNSVRGYNIYYGPHGNVFPTGFTLLSTASRTTAATTAAVGPGNWDFVIAAQDISFQLGNLATFNLNISGGTPAFPVTRSYMGAVGGAALTGTDTIPAGATSVQILLQGSGAAGACGDGTTWGGGSGEGGLNDVTYPLTPAFDNGGSLNWSLGAAGPGALGTNTTGTSGVVSTVTGPIHAGTLTLTSHGGVGAVAAGFGAGGTATQTGTAVPTGSVQTGGAAGTPGGVGSVGAGGGSGSGSGGGGADGGGGSGNVPGDGGVATATFIYN